MTGVRNKMRRDFNPKISHRSLKSEAGVTCVCQISLLKLTPY